MSKNPSEILASTSDQVRKIIAEILEIEKQHGYIQNIESNVSLEKDIGEEIIKLLEREIS